MSHPEQDPRREIRVLYTNHRGETSVRRLIPERICWGKSEWHPDEQWLLEGYDLDRQAQRCYSLKEIRAIF